jgi:hypothetical protein
VPQRSPGASPEKLPAPSHARTRALVWWGVAFASIIYGYVDLARGGETLAPILLIAGYCIFVPIAILQ